MERYLGQLAVLDRIAPAIRDAEGRRPVPLEVAEHGGVVRQLARTDGDPQLKLLTAMLAQRLDDKCRQTDGAPPGFRLGFLDAKPLPCLLEGPFDTECGSLEVDIGPPQGCNLSAPGTGADRQGDDRI